MNKMVRSGSTIFVLLLLLFLLTGTNATANETEELSDLDGPELSGEEENASNPLAAVNNTDLRWQYLDLASDRGYQNDYFIDGAFMIQPTLKLKYELH